MLCIGSVEIPMDDEWWQTQRGLAEETGAEQWTQMDEDMEKAEAVWRWGQGSHEDLWAFDKYEEEAAWEKEDEEEESNEPPWEEWLEEEKTMHKEEQPG